MEINFTVESCFSNKEFDNSKEALTFMAKGLLKQGYVKEAYVESVIKREEEYPTGLNSKTPKIAIPHTDHELVNKSAISVLTSKEGIEFSSMEDPDEVIKVNIIIMLALASPDGQLEMLQKVMGLVQNQDLKEEILLCDSDEKLFNKVVEALELNIS